MKAFRDMAQMMSQQMGMDEPAVDEDSIPNDADDVLAVFESSNFGDPEAEGAGMAMGQETSGEGLGEMPGGGDPEAELRDQMISLLMDQAATDDRYQGGVVDNNEQQRLAVAKARGGGRTY